MLANIFQDFQPPSKKFLAMPLVYSSDITKIKSCENLTPLNNIKLADSNIDNKNLAVDISVRTNFCWDIVLERFINGKSGPVALNRKVGYVLSGPIDNSHQDVNNSVMLTHVMKVLAEIIHSYNRIKDAFDAF